MSEQNLATVQFGRESISFQLPTDNVKVIEPQHLPALEDEWGAFMQHFKEPIGCKPFLDDLKPEDRLAVVIPDITRPLPTEKLLSWLFEAIGDFPAEQVVILSGTGTHRKNSEAEWIEMVGEVIYRKYRCVDNLGTDESTLVSVGMSPYGYEVKLNREYVQADKRILMGFIEPHFMAGFSGGYKAMFPGVAALESIMHYHKPENIGHPKSTWGVIEGNPTQNNVRAAGLMAPADLLINVTLDDQRAITGYFIGDPIEAHDAGCDFCRETSMVACEERFDIVVTSNSGYPLDQNLYQSVKGMSAAAKIVKPGGLIIMAARCNDGFPDHGKFKETLFRYGSMSEMLSDIREKRLVDLDQWQLQVFALLHEQAKIALYSELDAESVRRAHLEPIDSIEDRLKAAMEEYGSDVSIAILPEGPMTIPYVV